MWPSSSWTSTRAVETRLALIGRLRRERPDLEIVGLLPSHRPRPAPPRPNIGRDPGRQQRFDPGGCAPPVGRGDRRARSERRRRRSRRPDPKPRSTGLERRSTETRRALHRRPELSLEERDTAALAAQRSAGLGFTVRTGVGGTGVHRRSRQRQAGADADAARRHGRAAHRRAGRRPRGHVRGRWRHARLRARRPRRHGARGRDVRWSPCGTAGRDASVCASSLPRRPHRARCR